ncbi:hypothetical protein VNO77_17848 [Canavalia gladiata]|uniref:Leucine-rich repeat-containing N-terminal plant-type domain-containing protein n=1 Tax=Canavalia gladiata TaxID=3824 RepID=A0AAN9LPP8_CANGL
MAKTSAFRSCILIILMTWVCTASSKAISQRCHPQDKKALLQIKREFHSPSLEKAWDPHTDCCSWNHLSCDLITNRLDFFFFSGGLELHSPTPIPPSIGNLPYLTELQLHNISNLIGPIPPSFTNLKNLKTLKISYTNLSGEIPQFLTKLKTLTSIDLSYNTLFGEIPASLPSLRFLFEIILDGNHLSGPIPDSFGTFSKLLDTLTLSHNQLSGRIPPSFGKLDISTLDLSWNKLEGDASMLFGSNKKYVVLKLSGNSLAFDIGKVGVPKILTELKFDHNHIYGRLPEGLTDLKILEDLNVSFNVLCGRIPQGGNLQKFNASSYTPNKCLCDSPLPKCPY